MTIPFHLPYQVNELDGVLQIQDPHCWTLCSGTYIGSLRLDVLPGNDAVRLVAMAKSILKQAGISQVTIEVNFIE